jgi:hypothetical protein
MTKIFRIQLFFIVAAILASDLIPTMALGAGESCNLLFGMKSDPNDFDAIKDGSAYRRETYYELLRDVLNKYDRGYGRAANAAKDFAKFFYENPYEPNPGLEFVESAGRIRKDLEKLVIYPGLVQRRAQFFEFLQTLSPSEIAASDAQTLFERFSQKLGTVRLYRGISLVSKYQLTPEKIPAISIGQQSKALLKRLPRTGVFFKRDRDGQERLFTPNGSALGKTADRFSLKDEIPLQPFFTAIQEHTGNDGKADTLILSASRDRLVAEAVGGNYLRSRSRDGGSDSGVDAVLLIEFEVPVIDTVWVGLSGLYGERGLLSETDASFSVYALTQDDGATNRSLSRRIKTYPSIYESQGDIETLVPWGIHESEFRGYEVVVKDWKPTPGHTRYIYDFENQRPR